MANLQKIGIPEFLEFYHIPIEPNIKISSTSIPTA